MISMNRLLEVQRLRRLSARAFKTRVGRAARTDHPRSAGARLSRPKLAASPELPRLPGTATDFSAVYNILIPVEEVSHLPLHCVLVYSIDVFLFFLHFSHKGPSQATPFDYLFPLQPPRPSWGT
jgi:hypothetical protein